MKLITELTEEIEIIKEEKDGEKSLYIKGPFLQASVGNKNNRIYPLSVMEAEVDNYRKNYISKNRAFGELGHPDSPKINLDRASHIIKDLKQEGSTFVGTAKILTETPMGKIAKALINEGAMLGVSSRGVATLKKNAQGLNEVQNDFRLNTAADIVADPSAPDCFVQGVYEQAEWVYEASSNEWVRQKLDGIRTEVITLTAEEVEAKSLELFEAFLKTLSGVEEGLDIQADIKHPGALHRELHVPAGKKIPASKLKKAEHAKGKEGERARFAAMLEKLHK